MKLPEKIQRERKKMGLSQEKLAEKLEYQGRPSQNGRTAWHPLNWKKSSH